MPSARVRALLSLVASTIAALAFIAAVTPEAFAVRDHVFTASFGSEGSAAGQFREPGAVAVNNTTGDVYVIDKANNRLERFSSGGVFLAAWGWGVSDGEAKYEVCTTACRAGLAGTGSGQFDGVANGPFDPAEQVAVDNSANLADPSAGDVYVTRSTGNITGTPVNVIEKFTSAGEYLGSLAENEPGRHFRELVGVAVDPEGILWVRQQGREIDIFGNETVNSFIATRESNAGSGVLVPGFAVDGEDNMYQINENGSENHQNVISKTNSFGRRLAEEFEAGATAVAVDSMTNNAYIAHPTSVARYDSSVSLLERFGAGFLVSGAGVAVDSGIGPSSGNVYVADSATNSVVVFSLEPLAEPAVSESVSNVAATSATIEAHVKSRGLPTTFYFQYGTGSCATSPSACTSVPLPPGIDGGADFQVHSSSQHLQGLQPGVLYHYRVIASNALSPGGATAGPEETFTTGVAGGPFVLADSRRWELVSPARKNGAEIAPPQTIRLTQASEDGGAISYTTTGPFAGESSPSNLQVTQAFSRRGTDSWATQEISSRHDQPVTGGFTEFQLFSTDLSRALVGPLGTTPLSPEATERTVYLRDDATGSYTPLVTPANVVPGTEFGVEDGRDSQQGISFITATPDLSHVVLDAKANLTAEGETLGSREGNYYVWSGGNLRIINVLPANTPERYLHPSKTFIGAGVNGNTRHAIPDDGSRVFWGTNESEQLYLRDLTTAKSVRVSEPQGVPEPEAPNEEAHFQIASNDGSKVFFTEKGQLTTTPGGGLYVYDVNAPAAHHLTLLTVPLSGVEAAGVDGVMGASEDGSYLYLVASGVLSGNENGAHQQAAVGANNLYVIHSETHGGVTQSTTTFIARLSNGDASSWRATPTPVQPGLSLSGLTSRVSPNGRYLAFMSATSLTGYDNTDVRSGFPDGEVFMYDAGTARLVCASCNPSGARPEGELNVGLHGLLFNENLGFAWDKQWVAAVVPGRYQFPYNFGGSISPYQPRYLSDNGRLFFDSSDALVSADVNGTVDVYQYEPEGVGGCRDSSHDAGELFNNQAGGCVALISGGAGPGESVFADASASGEDVFFVTSDRLRSDGDNAYDMYDARVCGSRACFALSAVSPAPCATGDSCKPAPSSQPALFGAPASATFSGAGNLTPSSSKPALAPKSCRKGLRRKHGRCVSRRAKKPKRSTRKGRR